MDDCPQRERVLCVGASGRAHAKMKRHQETPPSEIDVDLVEISDESWSERSSDLSKPSVPTAQDLTPAYPDCPGCTGAFNPIYLL